jgi:predicted ATP pyrophosphatase (TIGR00289 family)
MKLDVAVLFSGGKDSTRTVEWCLQNHRVKYLLTFFPKNKESYMLHSVDLDVTKLASKALGLKQKRIAVSGEKEKEVEEMEEAIKRLKVDAIACGGIASSYQKIRFEKIARELGIKLFAPFWGIDGEKFLRETVDLGYEVIIVSVSSLGLDKSWLGRKIDHQTVDELVKLKKFGLNIVFEGGDAETLVLDGPIFKKRIEIIESEIVWDEKTNSGSFNVLKAKLVGKP